MAEDSSGRDELIEVPLQKTRWPWILGGLTLALLIGALVWPDREGAGESSTNATETTLAVPADVAADLTDGAPESTSSSATVELGPSGSSSSTTSDNARVDPDASPDEGSNDTAFSEEQVASNEELAGLAAEYLSGSGRGSAVQVERSGADLIEGPLLITVSDRDFVIETPASTCTSVEWSFTNDGLSVDYSSGEDCFTEHVMSPRTEISLQPATTYEVVATFFSTGGSEVFVLEITTAS